MKKLMFAPFLLAATTALASDVECKQGPAMLPYVTHAATEVASCLDSVTDSAGNTRAVFMAEPVGKSLDINALLIVDSNSGRQIRVEDPKLFPRGCGAYMMAARVLPGAEKVAAFYAGTVARVVDFSNPSAPTVLPGISSPYPAGFSTCEGYVPNWDALRNPGGWQVVVSVDPVKREISYPYSSRKAVDVVQSTPIAAADLPFYARAYDEECSGSLSEPSSQMCQDLKTAKDQATYLVRKKVYPKLNATASY